MVLLLTLRAGNTASGTDEHERKCIALLRLGQLPENCLIIGAILAVILKGPRKGWVVNHIRRNSDRFPISKRNIPSVNAKIIGTCLVAPLDIRACPACILQDFSPCVLAVLENVITIRTESKSYGHLWGYMQG